MEVFTGPPEPEAQPGICTGLSPVTYGHTGPGQVLVFCSCRMPLFRM